LYWRGPIWPVLNWLAYRGSLRYGDEALARSIRAAVLELARANGFWEHYNPATAGGQGGQTFTWTAAIVLDLLADDRQDDEGRTVEHNRTRRTT
jgi:glycogen debranching enzyme